MTDDVSTATHLDEKREEITFVLMFLTKHCSRGQNKTPLTEFFFSLQNVTLLLCPKSSTTKSVAR